MENLEALQNSVLRVGKNVILFDLMREPTKHLVTYLEHFEKYDERELCEGVKILLDNREKEFDEALAIII
ncbi:MAG TPA: hypothetical protein VNW06_06445 [Cytophagaceae bacterium]|jgi:hypothetical protein|nr:hypothetical protein [Cytophagaceae bacterium]